MAKTQTRPWDVVEHLETEKDMAAYLEAALEEGDPALIAAALGDIAVATFLHLMGERHIDAFDYDDSELDREVG